MAQYSVHVIIIMHPCHDQKEEGEKKVKVRDVNQWMVCDEGMKRLGIKFHGFSFACVSVAFFADMYSIYYHPWVGYDWM